MNPANNQPSSDEQCLCWACGRKYILHVAHEKFVPPCECASILRMLDEGVPDQSAQHNRSQFE
jgi:hypothetical protein